MYDPTSGRFTSEDPAMSGGNWYAYCGNSPLKHIDPDGLENIVVSGGLDGTENFDYNFIETAIRQIVEWKTVSDESISWVVANWNYSTKDLQNFREVADTYGVNLIVIDDKKELFNYINKPGRSDDLITDMAFYAHGTAFDVPGTVQNPGHENEYAVAMGYSGVNDGKHPHNNNLNIFASDLSSDYSSAFAADNRTFFGSCRTGNKFGGVIFGQEWANKTNGTVRAAAGPGGSGWPGGRTDYANIYPDNRNIVSRVLDVLGVRDSQASREVARARYGFSPKGSEFGPGLSYLAWYKNFKPKK